MGAKKEQEPQKAEDKTRTYREPLSPNLDSQINTLGEICTIVGGFTRGSLTSSIKKAHARRVRYEEIYLAE